MSEENVIVEKKKKDFSIIWKILFVAASLCLLKIFAITGQGTHSEINISEKMGLALVVVLGLIYILFGYLWSLGFKKKIYSPAVNKFNITLYTLFALGFPTYACLQGMIEKNNFGIVAIITLAIIVFLVFLIFSPAYILFFQYTKKVDTFEVIKAPCMRLLAFFTLTTIILGYALKHLMDVKSFLMEISTKTIADYTYPALLIYQSVFLIGFCLSKKILPQRFWQYSLLPFMLLYLWDNMHDTKGFSELLALPWTLKIALLAAVALLFKILYDYAFTNIAYQKEGSQKSGEFFKQSSN